MSARRSLRVGLALATALTLCMAAAGATDEPAASGEKGLTSTELIAASMAGYGSCLQWAPVGVCFWLTCSPWGCSVRTSIKVRHYAPDLAISTFHDASLHPWTDWGRTVSAIARKGASTLIGQASVDSAGTRSREQRTDKNIRYRDADAIGHPSIDAGLSSISSDYFCKQTVTSSSSIC